MTQSKSPAGLPERKDDAVAVRLSRRELATILAALRFHQDENLQGNSAISDRVITDIASAGGKLRPLHAGEVTRVCRRLSKARSSQAGEMKSMLVLVAVSGGVAEVLRKPQGVEVRIIDYDVEGEQPARLDRDDQGEACCIMRYPARQRVGRR